MKRSLFLVVTLMILVSTAPAFYSSDSIAETDPDIDYFDIKIVDDEGKEKKDILAHRYTVDTITDITGTTFLLRAHISLQACKCNILIESNEGEYNIYASVKNLSSYLGESGMRIELTDGSEKYISDLTKINDFEHVYFRDSDDSRAILRPNVMYPLSIMTLDNVSQEVEPEVVKDVTITFTAHLKEGMHQVAFISDGNLIDAYKLHDGEKIRPLPTVVKDGYEFQGWYTKNGEQIVEGRTVTENDNDIIAYASWIEIEHPPSEANFNWIIPVITIAIVAGLIIIFFYYRRRKESA